MGTMTIRELDQAKWNTHIRQICRENHISIIWRNGSCQGSAGVRNRIIRISPIKSQKSYMIALHEIGHILGRKHGLRLDQEAAAWDWALDEARGYITPATYRAIFKYLNSYLKGAESGRGRRKVPPNTFGFWDTYRFLERKGQESKSA